MKIIIEIAKNDKNWSSRNEINKKLIEKIAKIVLSGLEKFNKTTICEISVLLTNKEEIRKLNKDFRGKDKATNVLSFPDGDREGTYLYLGDVAFCHEVIEEEALSLGFSFKERFVQLLVHSILHLAGYDHEMEDEAEVMENLETEILSRLDVRSPY